MVKIEHVALYVNDLEGARIFFETYFASVSNALYYNLKTGFSSYFLTFSDGARLELLHQPRIKEVDFPLERLGFVHLAFSLASKERVNELTEQLKNDSYEVLLGPRTTGDGYYESCLLVFEGNQLELTI